MATDCKYCGAYIATGLDRCPACGKKIAKERGSAAAYAKAEKDETNEAYTYKDEFRRRYGDGEFERPEYSAERRKTDGEKSDEALDKTLAALCYLGPLFLIGLLLRKNSRYVRFHVNQGLLLFIAEIVAELCGIVILVGWIAELIIGIFCIVCLVRGLCAAIGGKMTPLPVIGDIQLIK